MAENFTEHGVVPLPPKQMAPAVHPEVGSYPAKPASSGGDDEQYPAPTEEERLTLRKVPDSIPATAYLLCIAELAERASYYCVTGVFNNFMEYPLPDGGSGSGAVPADDPNGHAGALDKGLQFASAFVLLFTFMSYVWPIFGSWIADTKLGRYKTIILGVVIGAVAHIIIIGGSAPSVLRAGNGLAPFMVSFFLLALGAGIFKPNVAPTVIDQYKHQRQYVRTLASGERVLVDPELTISRIMLIFYAFINIGSFFAIASTYAEKYVGYWLAYLIPGILYCIIPIVLVGLYKRTYKLPPQGSELNDFFSITWTALKQNKFRVWNKNFWDAARPAALAEKGITVRWSNRLVTDVGRTFVACSIFLYIPIWNINDGGLGAVQSNQGGSMTLNGAPNDLLSNFNPLTIIVFAPILSHGLYPLLNRLGIHFGPIRRLTTGFILAAISGIAGGIVQLYIYRTSPCGYQASTCDDVSPITIWWQLPNVMLGAISELFVMVTSYELAYTHAPKNLKSVVMALNLFTLALSAALSEILIPVVNDPTLVWVWIGPAVALFAQTAIFWYVYRDVDNEAYLNNDDSEEDLALPQQVVSAEEEGREKEKEAQI